MTTTRLILVAILALAAAGCTNQTATETNQSQPTAPATPSPSVQVDELALANEQYQKMCFACHGEKGEGGTKKIEDQTINVPSLREGHAVTHSDEELVKQVLDGGDGMPAFKDKLTVKQAADLVKYIRREFQ